ncbi:Fcf2-domain-containing protein [Schizopora paradoxa]|uniref:Fcf2-domain-containing protein n=1 Tax=Schizopora paradoxa TaxID=27342 RepID=A0A0H2RZ71_9AGAM|nr:Fcf2-domain-containing protein [Schizopora paradoxa]
MESLLEKARENMREKAKAAPGFEENPDEIRLSDEAPRPKDLPSLDPGNLPAPYFEFKKSRREGGLASARDVDSESLKKASSSISAPEPGKSLLPQIKKDGSIMTKKEKKTEKQKSAALGWADVPTPDAAELPRLYREVEALRLRNTLDPKRFYKKEEGEGKGIKGLPKQFAIGTIIPTNTPFGTASSDNLARAERKRTLVDELVDDSEAKRYAKRKFGDLQSVRAARGRGTFAKRFGHRRQKW